MIGIDRGGSGQDPSYDRHAVTIPAILTPSKRLNANLMDILDETKSVRK